MAEVSQWRTEALAELIDIVYSVSSQSDFNRQAFIERMHISARALELTLAKEDHNTENDYIQACIVAVCALENAAAQLGGYRGLTMEQQLDELRLDSWKKLSKMDADAIACVLNEALRYNRFLKRIPPA
jgi:hypothetical protein